MTLKENDSTLYHLAGRFCVELLKVSWIEQKLANTFFGPIPSVTHEDALNYFMKAYKIKPQWKENIYYICQELVALKRSNEASQYVKEALTIPANNSEERDIHTKLQEMDNNSVR